MSQEIFDTEYMTVWDNVTNTHEKIRKEDIAGFGFGDGLCGLVGSTDWHFKNLFCLYSNYAVDDDILRTTIDFYYNYQKKVGVIKDITINKISHHASPKYENFSDEMKAALLKIAKATLSDEINANLQGISPQFNSDTLSPSWRLNSLLEALYFSVFCMKPGFELYKECANPNCKREKFFLINATVTNKKYCCQACANATAQRRSRQRKMK